MHLISADKMLNRKNITYVPVCIQILIINVIQNDWINVGILQKKKQLYLFIFFFCDFLENYL